MDGIAAKGSMTGWVLAALATTHLAWVSITGAFRPEHLVLDGLALALVLCGERGRALRPGGLPLWLTGLVLDSQHLWLPLRQKVHTGDLWDLDRLLFPAPVHGLASTWPHYFWVNPSTGLDVLAGLAYVLYLLEFFGLLALLYFRKDSRFARMAWAFLAVNSLGCLVYLIYPAAPPWYVLDHGPGPANLAALPSAAGAARFDALTGLKYYANFYARNPNVFGSMPSLHTAYPVVALWQVWHLGRPFRAFGALFAATVAFSAIYLTHHYVLDVLGGIAAALTACVLVDLFFSSRWRRRA